MLSQNILSALGLELGLGLGLELGLGLGLGLVNAKDVNSFKNALDKHWYDRKFETPFS